jgi:hypothetical protein
MPGKKLPGRFRESEITRAVRGARKGGASVLRIDITKDGASIICGEQNVPARAEKTDNPTEINPWDEALYGKETAKMR